MAGLFLGTAGWSIPRAAAESFNRQGSSLQRYASRFSAVEVNSSFYRPHRQSTWQRWAAAVPPDFRFSVKVRKTITHEKRLVECDNDLVAFLDEIKPLGPKLAILLVQLPPTLVFDGAVTEDFFGSLASLSSARVVCEPRHSTWFDTRATALLQRHKVAQVAADPATVSSGRLPGGWAGLSYWRLHGSPQIYRSPYGRGRLAEYADLIAQDLKRGKEAWCMFDNTASSAAASDALHLDCLIGRTT